MVYVVIPCFKVKEYIVSVINQIGDGVDKILVVDDKCPEKTGDHVLSTIKDPRVQVIFHDKNMGVGAAAKTGFRVALDEGAEIIVKLDGDGQMDPKLIPQLIYPIQNKKSDYVKGNRFYDLEAIRVMPFLRLFGNSVLSLINKLVTGYWNIMDPTNGYFAIHRKALSLLPLKKIANRYFFESDMLFRLRIANAVVYDLPMKAKYGKEKSSLRISKVIFNFSHKYVIRFIKRIIYMYYLYDFNLASISTAIGAGFLCFGVVFGIIKWVQSFETGIFASCGTVMLTALPVILGFQLLIFSINFDVQNIPGKPLCSIDTLDD